MGRHVTESVDGKYKVITIYEEGMNHKRINHTRTGLYSIKTLHNNGQGYEWGPEVKKHCLGKKATNSQLNNKVKSS